MRGGVVANVSEFVGEQACFELVDALVRFTVLFLQDNELTGAADVPGAGRFISYGRVEPPASHAFDILAGSRPCGR